MDEAIAISISLWPLCHSLFHLVPLHRLRDRAVDKPVRAFALRFGVGLYQVFLALRHSNKNLVICFVFVSLYAFVAIFSTQENTSLHR